MDLTLTESEAAFRDEARDWFAKNHPGETPRGEILVERVKPLRFAEANGYDAVFEQLNGAH